MTPINVASSARWLATLAMAAGIAACNSDKNTAPVIATGISFSRQSDSAVVAGVDAPDTLMANVINRNGGLAGATVTWTVVQGSGTLGASTTISDALGNATTTFIPGTAAGPVVVTATVGSLAPANIDANVVAGAASTVASASGDAQSGTAGTALAAPCVVKVTDQYGNAVAGDSVTWATSGAGMMNPAVSITDSTGMASATLTLDTAPGAQTVTATIGTLTAASFTETGN